MRRLILAIAALLTLTAAAAQAGSVTYFGPGGTYAGTAFTHGRTTTYVGPGGRYEGSSTKRGRTTIFYDRQGRYAGTVIDRR